MNKVAKFEKVSYEQFKKDWIKHMLGGNLEEYNKKELEEIDERIRKHYDNIKLPKRATKGSAGYDIFSPASFAITNQHSMVIPTGIRCSIKSDWVLTLYPRSGHGFKYGIRLSNSVGIVDSDYYNANNEGHILVKLVNESVVNESTFCIESGQAFCQGVFLPYGVTEDDDTDGERIGGFGSTDKK